MSDPNRPLPGLKPTATPLAASTGLAMRPLAPPLRPNGPGLGARLVFYGIVFGLPALAGFAWWTWSGPVEDALPVSASSVARTTAALCDRGGVGWCYGLAFMYACGSEGLPVSMTAARDLDRMECEVDPEHCLGGDRMMTEWDTLEDDLRHFACSRNRIDTTNGLASLPDFLERRGTVVPHVPYTSGRP